MSLCVGTRGITITLKQLRSVFPAQTHEDIKCAFVRVEITVTCDVMYCTTVEICRGLEREYCTAFTVGVLWRRRNVCELLPDYTALHLRSRFSWQVTDIRNSKYSYFNVSCGCQTWSWTSARSVRKLDGIICTEKKTNKKQTEGNGLDLDTD